MNKRLSRQEALLEAAFHELALEETQHLKDQMMFEPSLVKQAEALHRKNGRRVRALIEKQLGKKRRQGWMALSAAACLALALLGTFRLFKAPEDQVIKPGPQVVSLTAQPSGTASPAPTHRPTPQVTPSPTQAPTPSPSPTIAPTPLEDSWPGLFYPASLPAGYRLTGVFKGEEAGMAHQAQFANDQTGELALSEYEASQVVEPGAGAEGVRYTALPGGATALAWEEAGRGAFVVWDQEGRTLVAHASSGLEEALAFAGSVKRIK